MPKYSDPAEVAAAHEALFPEGFAQLFTALWGETAALNFSWSTYCKLYHADDDDLELMSATAGMFFFYLETILFNDVLLSICRLLDPAKSGGRKNACLLKLSGVLQAKGFSELASRVDERSRKLCEKSNPIIEYRKKNIAHNDLKIALRTQSLPGGITEELIRDAIAEINSILNFLESEFKSPQTIFENGIYSGTATDLIWALKPASKYEKLEKILVKEGRLDLLDSQEIAPISLKE